jgi:cell division control protein 24
LEGFPLTPQTPRFSHHHHHSIDDDSIYNYDQDEEDFVGSLSENHSEDEEYTAPAVTPKSYLRTRRFSYQQHPRHADHPARKSLPHAGLLGNILSLPTSRHFNGTPGMTLPPLPRSPSNVSNLMNASIPTIQTHDNYTPVTYPSSPPSSYPSSPTTATTPSSHRNSASIPSGSLWQRRQGSEPKEKINAYNHPHHQSSHIPITPPPTRHQEHLTIPTPPPPPPPLNHVRARSQSSPNIQRPVLKGGHTCELTKINYEKRKSNGYRFEDRMMLPSQPLPGEITKLKVHYFGAIYIVIVPSDIQFDELVKRIGSKIKVFEAVLGLKYEDEEGDLITINSNEDIQMGFESKGMNNAVNLYVTC